MFGGASNSSSSASKSEIDPKTDGKSPSPESSPDFAVSASTPISIPEQAAGGEKRSGNESPPTRNDSGDRKRRSSGVGSRASSLLASAKNSFNFSHMARSNSNLSAQTPLQKLGKHDPALAVPQGQHNNSAGESVPGPGSTFRVGVWEDRNKKCRRTMEDTHSFLYNFLDTPPPAIDGYSEKHSLEKDDASSSLHEETPVESDNGYFAIFDGHAGTFAADWCGKKLHLILEDMIRKSPNVPIPELLDQTFTSVDAQLEKLPLKNSGCTAAIAVLRWEDRVPSDRSATGSLAIAPAAAHAAAVRNSKLLDAPQGEKEKKAPQETIQALQSEAVTMKLKGASSHQRVLYTANVGDARIILCRSGRALRLSYDHKGSDENEGKRIANAGGLILNNRVNGVLAVTRALGDAYIKDLVTGHPYTTETVIQPELDEFIIIACDGLWDVCSDQEAVDLVQGIANPVMASKVLVDHALSRFSTDNLSCMIVRLDQEGHLQRQKGRSAAGGGDYGLSEADKIVKETKQKIMDGTAPATGVSASNSGRGYEAAPGQEEFIPTILNGTVEEEPGMIEEGDST